MNGLPCPYTMTRLCMHLMWKKLNFCWEDLLLQALGAGLGVDQSLKDGEHMTAVFDQAREDIAKGRLAFGLAMPFEEDCLRNFNVAAEFFGRVPAQEQAVKESRLPLREVEVVLGLLSHVGCGGDGRVCVSLHLHLLETEKAVYPKFCRRQVLLRSGDAIFAIAALGYSGQPGLMLGVGARILVPPRERGSPLVL
jgi:hypothetical protein